MIDTLPTGLTAAAISGGNGNGWNCTLATLTCTRSDALNPGSSYPPINEALGVIPVTYDLSGTGMVNVVDVQIEINAALGLGCAAR